MDMAVQGQNSNQDTFELLVGGEERWGSKLEGLASPNIKIGFESYSN